jgi:acetylglutamate kinase
MQEAMEKAKVLLESLPYMREFSGQTVVIKYGGSAMTEESLKQSFALNIVLLKYIGINPVIVHGGGPQIGKMLTQLGIDSTFRQGLRVTDPETMDVVEMVLVGKVNKEIVNLINQSGGLAVGLSGKDGRLIEAEKLEMILSRKDAPPEIIDLGRVGEVRRIRTDLPDALQRRGFIPIIAPVGVDDSGATYNINADDVTAAVAEALGARRMILLTDVEGVMSGEGLISSLSRREAG